MPNIQLNESRSPEGIWSLQNSISALREKIIAIIKCVSESFSSFNEIGLYCSGKLTSDENYLNEKSIISQPPYQDIGTENLSEVPEISNATDEDIKKIIDPKSQLDGLRIDLIETDRENPHKEDNRVSVAFEESEKLRQNQELKYLNEHPTKKVTGCLLRFVGISQEDLFEMSSNVHGQTSEDRLINSLDTTIRKHTLPNDRLHVASILISKYKLTPKQKEKLIHTVSFYKDNDDSTNYKSLLNKETPSWDAAPEERKAEAEAYLKAAFSRGDALNFNLANFGSKDATLVGGLSDKERNEIMQTDPNDTQYRTFLCMQILSHHLDKGTVTPQQLKNYLKTKGISIPEGTSPLLEASEQLLKELEIASY